MKARKSARKPLFACAHCKHVYKTKAEALACPKPIESHCKKGDLIERGGRVWKIVHMPDHSGLGTIEKVKDYLLAEGYDGNRGYQADRWAWPCSFFCKDDSIKKVSIDKMKKTLARRKKQVRAAENVIAYLKEQDG